MTPVTSPTAVAVSTSAWTESREETSTVAVVTSKPALLSTSAAASAFSWCRSAIRTVLPALTRRAIAWPIEPAPITTITLLMKVSFQGQHPRSGRRAIQTHRHRLSAPGSVHRPSLHPHRVLLVRHLLQPGHCGAVLHLSDGDMRHGAVRRRAVPVLLARLEPDDVAGSGLLDRGAFPPHAAETGDDHQRLAERVRMPRGTRARLKGDSGRAHPAATAEPSVGPDSPGEVSLGPLLGRLRAAALDVHFLCPTSSTDNVRQSKPHAL